jgi:hypothetical protein
MQSFLKPINNYQYKADGYQSHKNASSNSFQSMTSLKQKQTTSLSASLSTLKLKKQKSTTTTTTTTTTSSSKQDTDDDNDNEDEDDVLFKKYTKDYENNLDFYLSADCDTTDATDPKAASEFYS